MTKTLLDSPKYFNKLYHQALEETRKLDPIFKLDFPKWKKDILLSLLERAKPKVKRKYLRKIIRADLKKVSDEAWEEM